jgi:hypothetical protein
MGEYHQDIFNQHDSGNGNVAYLQKYDIRHIPIMKIIRMLSHNDILLDFFSKIIVGYKNQPFYQYGGGIMGIKSLIFEFL